MRKPTPRIQFLATALIVLSSGCASNDEPPERDFSKGNPNMMDKLKGRAKKLLGEAEEAFKARNYAEANAVYKLAAEAAELEKDVSLEVEALSQVARCYSIQRVGPTQGKPYLERARKKASKDHPLGWTRYLGVRGIYEREREESVKATETFKEMYEFAKANGLPLRAIDAAHHIAIAAAPADQVEWGQKGIAAAEEAGSKSWLAVLWNNLGASYEDLELYGDAVAAYTKARALHHEVGDERAKLAADWALGHAYRLDGKLDPAQELLDATLERAERRYTKRPGPETAEWVGYTLQDLGELAVARGEKTQGLATLESARLKWKEAHLDTHWAKGFKKLEDRIAELR